MLAPIAYSGAALQSLSISFTDTELHELCNWETMRYLAHLKSLVIALHMNYGHTLDLASLGPLLLARMPRLHTFLLSDVSLKRYDLGNAFLWARDEALQSAVLAGYEFHAPALRRVAFTTEFEWEKRADGRWHAWGHVFLELPMLLGWQVRLED
ncbi:uncharacterized protein TRAVEDRAFT_19523 [Trametes versicolor FP-101664 SS1]|uniref:uncharacterized protein n=1 Tax=Trametes versicolor (strain FP-101664) TaxID=717944 RepID=UPI000462396C|nr:uncharacterized protein TRAVEDRAFT_19523 [Trametes versicolor FP-101664 SS1]EIW61027.1 hypothetical protein TRAVEDRAFT_19523 [Trametes versicolor FP-101664 SS1]